VPVNLRIVMRPHHHAVRPGIRRNLQPLANPTRPRVTELQVSEPASASWRSTIALRSSASRHSAASMRLVVSRFACSHRSMTAAPG
jgi:hypothetical protein